MELTREAVFSQHRGLVFAIAYDITGSVSDAEDVTQETYLRWTSPDAEILDPRAYLAVIAANQARNALRSTLRRREDYIGPWLGRRRQRERGAAADRGHQEDPALLLGLAQKHAATAEAVPVELNGALGVLFFEDGAMTTAFHVDVADDPVRNVGNPDALHHLQ